MRQVRRGIGSVLMKCLGPPVVGALARSWKLVELGRERWEAALARPGMIVTLWHGRMVLAMPAGRDANLAVLVSPSGDGRLVLPLLERFGYRYVLGSSNKNPARAVRELVERLEGGGRIVITPDGPRGPRHATNPGPAWLARETGHPILPVGCAADPAWHLKSWDRFTLPRFRARVVVSYGELLDVPRDAGDVELARATEEMRARMLAAEERAFEHLGIPRDW